MWDLETIIKINNEAQAAFEKKNAIEAHQCEEVERRKRILEGEDFDFNGVAFVRSLYEGKLDGHTSQGGEGKELS